MSNTTTNIGEIIKSKETIVTTEAIGSRNSKTTVSIDNCKGYKATGSQVDLLVDDAATAGVTNPQMRAWYCKAAYKLGADIFMRTIAQAKEGRDPVKLFSYLLNMQMNSPTATGKR